MMINVMKRERIFKEISQIEGEQEETQRCIKSAQLEEEYTYEYLRKNLQKSDIEFEACQGDSRLMRLIEEKYNRLQEIDRECGEYLGELHKEQMNIKYKCETDIDELRCELQRLEML